MAGNVVAAAFQANPPEKLFRAVEGLAKLASLARNRMKRFDGGLFGQSSRGRDFFV
jgi:hypothetical protein